ncbi:MAG: bacterial transcriptional activator domain-containing protein [Caldilineaceae bacterium]
MSRVQGELTVTLLGDVRVTFDGRTAAALLGQQRGRVAGVADSPSRRAAITPISCLLALARFTEAQALTNLRKTLLLLRRHLPAADDYLDVQRALLQWRPRGPVSVDVLEFEQHLLAAAQAPAAAEEAAHLTAALDLYRGDLLPGLYGEWIFPLRERLRQAYMGALLRIVTLLEDTRAYAAAVTYAQRAVEHDPLHEAGYLRLLRLHALSGDRARALRVYHTCATVLAREMGVEPNAELQDAYMRLLTLDEAGAAGAPQRPAPASAAVELVGREREWQTLVACWRGLDRTPVHVVTVAGEGRAGQSTPGGRAAQLGRAAGHPDGAGPCLCRRRRARVCADQ